MVFAIPPHAQAPCFDRGKAEPDGLAQGGSVDVRDSVLITNPSVREIQSLAGNISIRVRGIVCRQPVKYSDLPGTGALVGGLPSLNKNLLCTVGCARCRGGTNVGSELLKGMVGTEGHTTKCAGGMDCVLAGDDGTAREQ